MVDALEYFKAMTINVNQNSVILDADGDSLENDLVLDEGENALVLIVTEQQYTDLLSSAINGVYTTFPENPLGVIYPLIKAGKMQFCEQILACLNDPESGVANAIMSLINSGDYQANRDSGQSYNNANLAGAVNPTCDRDILFGQCLQIVEYIDTINDEFFAKLEVATNDYDFIADVVGDITLIDETSIDAVLAWLQFVQDSIAENYNAQSDTAYKEALACEIYCIAKDYGCAVTPTILYNVVKDRLSATITIEGVLWDALQFLVLGSWEGSQIADFMYFAQFAFRSMLGKFFQKIAWSDIESRMVIYSNDPNPDWSLLCTDCQDSWIFDYRLSENGASGVDNLGGAWVDGVGWTFCSDYPRHNTAWESQPFPSRVRVTRIEVQATFYQAKGESARNVTLYDSVTSTQETHQFGYTGTGTMFYAIDTDFVADSATLRGGNQIDQTSNCSGSYLTKCTIFFEPV